MMTLAEMQAESKRHKEQLANDPARFDVDSYQQAKAELAGLVCDPITYIRKVAKRAQEIKQENSAKK
jgi:hypothetical protein